MLILLLNFTFSFGCSEDKSTEPAESESKTVEFWLTDPTSDIKFAKQKNIAVSQSSNSDETIFVNAS
ncbi:MAG: hypothetical protein U5K00_01145, partial [Melioribacteraceae bacterium]|nr:hypothetical protein [Melioribacteraceae bacterium]